MTHPSELVSAYLDGELGSNEVKTLLKHLSSCGRCSAELEDMQRVRTAVRSLPLLELPDGVIPGADADIIPLKHNPGLWVGTAAAVVALVIAVAALVTPPPVSVSVEDLSSRFGARASVDPAFSPAKVVIPELNVVGE